MSRGLDTILQRIKDHASLTLVRRYLALVAELKDDHERAKRMLAAAQAIERSHPSEALRIAYLVYSMGRELLPSLDVMIAVLATRGPSEKLKSLSAERDRLRQVKGVDIAADIPSLDLEGEDFLEVAKGPQRPRATTLMLDHSDDLLQSQDAPIFKLKTPEPQSLRQALLVGEDPFAALMRLPKVSRGGPHELGPRRERIIVPTNQENASVAMATFAEEQASGRSVMLDRLFEVGSPTPESDVGESSAVIAARGENVAQFALSPRSVVADDVHPQFNEIDIFAEVATPSVGLAGERHEKAPQHAAAPATTQGVPASDLGAAVQLFDHYWRQGDVNNAREVLTQTEAVSRLEPWWQARDALIKQSLASSAEKHMPHQRGDAPQQQKDEPVVYSDHQDGSVSIPYMRSFELAENSDSSQMLDFEWRSLYAELLRIVARGRLPLASTARFNAYGQCLAGKALPDGFIKALAAAGGDRLTQHARDLLWDFIATLWRGEPDESLYELLRLLKLQFVEPRWLGLYLDALLATGRAFHVSHVMLLALEHNDTSPRLAWANIAMPRIIEARRRLGLVALRWHEDEGVELLRQKLSKRAQPRLRGLLLGERR